ncbi:hypothetical protein PFISCL1PPCAC_24516, partial [Pristionchus fissidentatus]
SFEVMDDANDKLPLVDSGQCGHNNPYFDTPPPYVESSVPMNAPIVPPSLQQLQPPIYDRESEILQQHQRAFVVDANSTPVHSNQSVIGEAPTSSLNSDEERALDECVSRFVIHLLFMLSMVATVVSIVFALLYFRDNFKMVYLLVDHLYIPIFATALLLPGSAIAFSQMEMGLGSTSGISFLIKSMYFYKATLVLYVVGIVGAMISYRVELRRWNDVELFEERGEEGEAI